MTDGPTRIFAIVPAAGQSRRMGCDKQLLDVGGRPMLAAVVDSLFAAGVDRVVVVTRSDVAAKIGASLPSNTLIVPNDNPATEMIDSIRIGLDAWAGRERIEESDGVVLVPGDQPGIAPACIQSCVAAFVRDPGRVVVATYQGRRGHPLIFSGSLIGFVRSSACDGGLRALPTVHADRVQAVECECHAVTRDVDCPDDYRALR
jgi:molybdenum cofactor cytidylyltransferase